MYTIYQVMPGDTLDSLARSNNINLFELRRINNFPFNYEVSVGEQIILPSNNSDFMYYTVVKGDTMYGIAKKFNVDLNTLLQVNGLNANDFIYPDEKIMIPNGNANTYIVKENDTINDILNNANISIEELIRKNERIFLLPGQLLIIS